MTRAISMGSDPGEFLQPGRLGVDAEGNVYVADFGNDRVQEFGPALNYFIADLRWASGS
jgi:hypothetical protein